MSQGRESIQTIPEEPLVDDGDFVDEELEDEGTSEEQGEEFEETARETVERVLREETEKAEVATRGESENPNDGESEPVEAKDEKAEEPKPEKRGPGRPKLEPIEPPNRFTAKGKEVFSKAPRAVQEELVKMVNEQHTQFTKAMTDVKGKEKAIQNAEHVLQVVRPYLHQHPELMEAGFTEASLVQNLVAAHIKLTDPKTKLQTWLQMGGQMGVAEEDLQNIASRYGAGAVNPQVADISQHPEHRSVQEENNRLKSTLTAYEQQQVEQNAAIMQTVVQEKDAAGNYIYPELHDKQFTDSDQVKSLVSALCRTLPPDQALRQAVMTMRSINGTGNTAQVNQTKLPTQNSNNKPLAPPVSVRGSKSAPQSSVSELDKPFPNEALKNPRETARYALEQMRKIGS